MSTLGTQYPIPSSLHLSLYPQMGKWKQFDQSAVDLDSEDLIPISSCAATLDDKCHFSVLWLLCVYNAIIRLPFF